MLRDGFGIGEKDLEALDDQTLQFDRGQTLPRSRIVFIPPLTSVISRRDT